jgi:hypothetical protein
MSLNLTPPECYKCEDKKHSKNSKREIYKKSKGRLKKNNKDKMPPLWECDKMKRESNSEGDKNNKEGEDNKRTSRTLSAVRS